MQTLFPSLSTNTTSTAATTQHVRHKPARATVRGTPSDSGRPARNSALLRLRQQHGPDANARALPRIPVPRRRPPAQPHMFHQRARRRQRPRAGSRRDGRDDRHRPRQRPGLGALRDLGAGVPAGPGRPERAEPSRGSAEDIPGKEADRRILAGRRGGGFKGRQAWEEGQDARVHRRGAQPRRLPTARRVHSKDESGHRGWAGGGGAGTVHAQDTEKGSAGGGGSGA